MDAIITNKRREEIINTIVEIVKKFKDNDEVEAILWNSYKGTTITRNIIGFLTLGDTDDSYTKTGNVLCISIIYKGDRISRELQDLINETEESFENFKTCHRLGVDIKFNPISSKECNILTADNRKKLIELYKMNKYQWDFSRVDVLEYINEDVYPDGMEARETIKAKRPGGETKIEKRATWLIIADAKEYVDKNHHVTSLLNLSHLILDKSPDGYYTKVATQLKDKIEFIEPTYDRFVKVKLDLKLGDKVELKLKRDNIS